MGNATYAADWRAPCGRRTWTSRLFCCPLRGNVPLYDILAANSSGQAIPIQVKAINGGSWQFDAKHYLNIVNGKDRQKIEGAKPLPNPNLLCIFVLLKRRDKDERDKDYFYLFPLSFLQEYTKRVYKPRTKSSKNPQSTHCAISPKDLTPYKDNWPLLEATLSHSGPPD
jgi:hypothetical protein